MNYAEFVIDFKNKNSSRQAIFPIWLRAASLLPWAIFAFKGNHIMAACKAQNCEIESIAKGYCQRHYDQLRRRGKIFKRFAYLNDIQGIV